jgi:hypothetical protein
MFEAEDKGSDADCRELKYTPLSLTNAPFHGIDLMWLTGTRVRRARRWC